MGIKSDLWKDSEGPCRLLPEAKRKRRKSFTQWEMLEPVLNLPCKGVESGGSLNNTLSRKPCGQNSDKDCSSTACAGDIGFILVSSGCCNNMPHSRWLKTIEIYSFTVLEARCPKSRCEQDGLLGRLWRGTCSMPFSSILVMASDPWHSLPC